VLGIIPSRIAFADRYTYLPQIGLLVALVWGGAELAAAWRVRPGILATVSAGVVLALGALAFRQTRYWRDSETLWRHTLACSTNDTVAYYNLADAIGESGRNAEAIGYLLKTLEIDPTYETADVNLGNLLLEEGHVNQAMACFAHALQLDPGDQKAHNDRGQALLQIGRPTEAAAELRWALEINPNYAKARYNLGIALGDLGQYESAVEQYKLALGIQPAFAEADYNLGNVLMALGRTNEAVPYFRQALKLKPNDGDIHNNLGSALMNLGQFEAAAMEFKRAVELQPANASATTNLAWLLATLPDASMRNGGEALRLAQRASQLTGNDNPLVLRTLAAAYAETGQFDLAVQNARLAIPLAEAEGVPGLSDELERELADYQQGLPFRMDADAKQRAQ
ncbi:MAG: tetratricopeptide repeat protein, partial [Opitutales bacterium]